PRIAADGLRRRHADEAGVVLRAGMTEEAERRDLPVGARRLGGVLQASLDVQDDGAPTAWPRALRLRERRDRECREEQDRSHARAEAQGAGPLNHVPRLAGRRASCYSPSLGIRRGDRVVEGARLLSVCRGSTPTEGSNPALSAP